MDLQLSQQDMEFREEVRDFLKENLTEDILDGARRTSGIRSPIESAGRWARKLAKKGWLAHTWAKEDGGPGWSVVQRYIYDYECAMAGTPALYSMGTRMCGPVILKFGTPEQKAEYIPKILSDEDVWCQGYSEPGSGSDLASLQCRAVRDGDHYVVNGSKIWTTGAHHANRIFCLVRTSNEGKPQQGITFLLIDMDTPGIKVDPILMFSGDHELNQVFFDDVRVPVENRVGEENQGWTVAKYLLEFERGGQAHSPGLKAGVKKLLVVASQERSSDGQRLVDDPSFRARIAELEVQASAAEMTEKRVMSALSLGQNPGPASSMFKLRGSETMQLIAEMMLEAVAYYGGVYQPEVLIPGNNADPVMPDYAITFFHRHVAARAATIYAGSSEVQRSIIAKQVLHL